MTYADEEHIRKDIPHLTEWFEKDAREPWLRLVANQWRLIMLANEDLFAEQAKIEIKGWLGHTKPVTLNVVKTTPKILRDAELY
jgi:hypothetical protein